MQAEKRGDEATGGFIYLPSYSAQSTRTGTGLIHYPVQGATGLFLAFQFWVGWPKRESRPGANAWAPHGFENLAPGGMRHSVGRH